MDQRSPKYASSTYMQKLAAIGAICSAATSLVMTANWANGTDVNEQYMGGLNWRDKIFNWHPILMVAGLIFCSVTSLVTYRIIPLSKLITKSIHVFCHTAAVVCLSIGFSAVYINKNDYNNQREPEYYYANFTSIHALVGLAAIILYGQNYVFGILFFLLPVSADWKRKYMPNHVFLGLFALVTACMAALTGVMDYLAGQCEYYISSPDTNPAENYHELSAGCKLGNGVGILVLLTAFLGVFALLERTKEEEDARREALLYGA